MQICGFLERISGQDGDEAVSNVATWSTRREKESQGHTCRHQRHGPTPNHRPISAAGGPQHQSHLPYHLSMYLPRHLPNCPPGLVSACAEGLLPSPLCLLCASSAAVRGAGRVRSKTMGERTMPPVWMTHQMRCLGSPRCHRASTSRPVHPSVTRGVRAPHRGRPFACEKKEKKKSAFSACHLVMSESKSQSSIAGEGASPSFSARSCAFYPFLVRLCAHFHEFPTVG